MAQDLKLNVSISGDFKSLERGLRSVQKSVNSVGKSFTKVGKSLSLFVTGPLAALGVQSVRAFDRQAQAVAQLEQGLRSTGNAAGFTSQQLQKIASDLQGSTLFGDEEILQGATNQLLTFTNIAGEQFLRTQQAALDLSTRLGGDLQSASIQLGKALNDPVANLSALSRSGIQFSKEQKDLINSLVETNRLADAQTIILNELEKQYGGSAAAAARAGLGPFKQFQNTLGDLSEEIGEVLTPTINSIATTLTRAVQAFRQLSPEIKQNIVLYGVFAAAIGPGLIALGSFIRLIGFAVGGLSSLAGAFAALFSPIGLIIAGIAALGTGIALVITRFNNLRNAGLGVFDSIKIILLDIADIINFALVKSFQEFLNLAVRGTNFINSILGREIQPLFSFDGLDNQIDALRSKILDAANIEESEIPGTVDTLLNNIGNAASEAFNRAKDATKGFLSEVGEGINSALPKLNNGLKKTKENAFDLNKELRENAPQQAASGLANAFTAVAEGSQSAKEAFSDFASSFLSQISQMILQSLLLNSIQGAFGIGTTPGQSAATGGLINSNSISNRFAEGGPVTGPGTGTSDSIVARLSNGEFVSDARTVGFFGPGFFQNLKRISRGQFQMPAFNQGGFVGMASGSEFLSRSGGGVGTIEIRNSGNPKEVSRTLTREEAQGTVTTIFLDDIQRNGPISKALSRKNRSPQR
jgi:phage-related protein